MPDSNQRIQALLDQLQPVQRPLAIYSYEKPTMVRAFLHLSPQFWPKTRCSWLICRTGHCQTACCRTVFSVPVVLLRRVGVNDIVLREGGADSIHRPLLDMAGHGLGCHWRHSLRASPLPLQNSTRLVHARGHLRRCRQ